MRWIGPALCVCLLAACRSTDRAAAVNELVAKVRAARSAEERVTALHSLSEIQPRFLEDIEDPTPAVEALLGDADTLVVAKAAELLAFWGDRAAVPALIGLLKGGDVAIGVAALTALTALPDPRARAGLFAALRDPAGPVRAQACSALARLGDPAALPALRERLGDTDGAVRAAAARALGRFGSPEDVDRLIALLEDREPGVADAAAEGLGRLGDRRAVPPLLARLTTGRQGARRAAAVALGRLGEPSALSPLLAMLREDAPALQVAALMSLRQLGDPAAAPRVRLLAESEDFNITFRVPFVLASLYRREQRERYEYWISHGTPAMRAAVTEAVGYAADPGVIPALVGALNDDSAYVRASAARSLGLLGGADQASRLRALSTGDRSELVRDRARMAMSLLAQGGDIGARLISVLDHEDAQVRMDAASILGLLGIREALPALERRAALEEKWWVRGSVEVAMLRFQDPEV